MSLATVNEEFENIDTSHNGYVTRRDLEDYARRTEQDSDFVDVSKFGSFNYKSTFFLDDRNGSSGLEVNIKI